MEIYAISDMHGMLPSSGNCPECDLLLIGGDICPDGVDQLEWLDTTFRAWLSALPAKNIVGIAGNHDFIFESKPDSIDSLDLPWCYLRNSGTDIDGLKVYGIPYVPNLPSWAFYAQDHELDSMYQEIPSDTDVILSHGPAFGYGDLTSPRYGSVSAGSHSALHALDRVTPMVFICGHIHEGRGSYTHGSTSIYNVSAVTERYIPHGQPFIEIEIEL